MEDMTEEMKMEIEAIILKDLEKEGLISKEELKRALVILKEFHKR